MIYEGKQDKVFYISLPVMLIGNAIGAFAFGYAMFFAFRNTEVFAYAQAAANSRLALNSFMDYLSTAIKSFLCGLCVYLAVKSFNLNRLKPLGIGLLVFFVFVFVYCGFQHCIANMFYFGFGNHISGYTFINLALVIIFNSIGPILGILIARLIKR